MAAVEAASRAGIPSVVGDPAVDPTARAGRLPARGRPVRAGRRLRPARAQPDPRRRASRACARCAPTSATTCSRGACWPACGSGCARRRRRRARPRRRGPSRGWRSSRPGSLAKLVARRARARARPPPHDRARPRRAGRRRRRRARDRAPGRDRGARLAPAPLLFSERVLSETYVRSAGALGRIGAIQGVSEVATNTADAELYKSAVPLLFRGEIASVDGLRGYVTGPGAARRAALGHRRATRSSRACARRACSRTRCSRRGARAQPGAGSPFAVALQPQFLSPTLVPTLVRRRGEGHRVLPAGQLDGDVRRAARHHAGAAPAAGRLSGCGRGGAASAASAANGISEKSGSGASRGAPRPRDGRGVSFRPCLAVSSRALDIVYDAKEVPQSAACRSWKERVRSAWRSDISSVAARSGVDLSMSCARSDSPGAAGAWGVSSPCAREAATDGPRPAVDPSLVHAQA